MPELPEAETIVRGLRAAVVGRTVTGAEVVHHDILAPGLTADRLAAALKSRRIEGVSRRGKNVVLLFNPGMRLVVNLGMTGRVVSSASARAGELRHVAVRFPLDDGAALLYDDARRFGRVALLTARAWALWTATLGPEPLSADFTGAALHAAAAKSRTPIRNWLLDQRRVAGIGNIYANEALFRAGLRPDRTANTLTEAEAAALRNALVDVLEESIAARGTTFSDYRDASGEEGAYQPRLRVYGREFEPCRVCGTAIRRIVLSNRSAFFCPACQP